MSDGSRAWLDGWKAIAEFLAVSEKTARNWERNLGLPVANKGPRLVVARRDDLAQWMASRRRRRPQAA